MGIPEAQSEKLIKDKAKILFFQKGFMNATMQEIADEAGVNRTLIHYYFRSREQLLDILLDETLQEKKDRIMKILSSDLPFREKIAHYINTLVNYGLTYPYLDNFIISETARHPDRVIAFCSKDKAKSSDFIKAPLEAEIKAGRLAPISAEHFMVNLSSLCNYPLLAKSILKTIHGMTDTTYRKFLTERKQIIYMTIFNEPMPDLSTQKKIVKN